MATETGTATDYRDLLQKLKAFLTGTNSPESGLSWVVEEERSQFTSPLSQIAQGAADELMEVTAANDQSHDQIIFRGNGGTSPEKEIYFGIQTYGLSTTGYYNWQIRGLTGFATSSPQYVALADQPGRSPPAYLLLQNTTMTYWFIGNNRRVMGAVKTGTAYQTFYIGFLNPYATDVEFPYPMCISASGAEEDIIFSSNAINVSGMLNPGSPDSNEGLAIQGDVFPVRKAIGWCRFVDGNWYATKNFHGTTGSETGTTGATLDGILHTYPFGKSSQTPVAEGNKMEDTQQWGQDWTNVNPGGTPTYQLLPAFGSPGLTTLWPLTIYNPHSHQLFGDLDGCYWCPGAGGITSEDTMTDTGESPEVEHIIFQMAWRTDAWSYMAMRNE